MEFIETFKVTNSNIDNLYFHNLRFNNTRKFFFNSNFLNLQSLIKNIKNSRCRIIYNNQILNIEYFPIQKREFKSFKIVKCNDIDYSFKYKNRDKLNSLKDENYDEVIIIKNGLITDTTISNLAFFDGKEWLTPKEPLLKGTYREKLLDEKIIKEANISIDELKKFQKFAMINAILEFQEIDIKCIKRI
jgi:4-amino-4-deoxychorismate lyase